MWQLAQQPTNDDQILATTATITPAAEMAAAAATADALPVVRLGHSVPVVSFAAAIESFYRSAMNSQINYRLTRTRGPLFPRMHVQMPTRVAYINGFKGIRFYIDANVDPYVFGSNMVPVVG